MLRSILSFIVVGILSLSCWLGIWDGAIAAPEPTQISPGEFIELQTIFEEALTASQTGEFIKAEKLWTQLIEKYPNNPAFWSNRGNIRVSQNQLELALSDYQKAIELAPDAPDPYLNRGIVYERLGKWDEAIADYNLVLEIDPEDAIAYNNRGNAQAGLGEWEKAIGDYQKAFKIAPSYAFARANYALALYQNGQTSKSISIMKKLAKKYTNFADMRAALTACLWQQGKRGEAESNWIAAVGLDSRYQDLDWVANIRRWPPKVVSGLEQFLKLQ